MLAERCQGVFKAFFLDEGRIPDAQINEDELIKAFEEGTLAAKARLDIGFCPYSASKESSKFLAWLSGFRCCSQPASRR